MFCMAPNQLKFNIESDVRIISSLMKEIQRMDAFIKTLNDPEQEYLMAQEILKLGDKFEEFTERLKKNLSSYLEEQRISGEPINFSYQKLYNKIKV